jgi:hypothetical protein
MLRQYSLNLSARGERVEDGGYRAARDTECLTKSQLFERADQEISVKQRPLDTLS